MHGNVWKPGQFRWASQPGSVYLSDQKVGISVPRASAQRGNE